MKNRVDNPGFTTGEDGWRYKGGGGVYVYREYGIGLGTSLFIEHEIEKKKCAEYFCNKTYYLYTFTKTFLGRYKVTVQGMMFSPVGRGRTPREAYEKLVKKLQKAGLV